MRTIVLMKYGKIVLMFRLQYENARAQGSQILILHSLFFI
jgi:hypothetical protein